MCIISHFTSGCVPLPHRDNNDINGDHRNVVLTGTIDGVPYFDDQRRGAWPFILRTPNLPDGTITHIGHYTHN
jgi:hypothetical protein